jgi:hypothetical protein
MDAAPESPNRQNPHEIYSNRLQELHRARTREQHREKLFGFAKLTLAAITLIFVLWLLRHPAVVEILFAPVAVFVLLAVQHEKLLHSIRLHTRSIEFYNRGLARLENRWAGRGETGERFLDPQHPYARDLDLFGKASLFELVCTVRTRAGEETLAAWLLSAAPVPEILARQSAVRDLAPRVGFREKLFLLGETVRVGIHPDALSMWGERGLVFPSRAARVITSLLAVFWIASLVAWGVWGLGWTAASMTILNLAWAHRIHARMDEASDSVEKSTQDLELLAGVLSLLAREHFASPKLLALQAALKTEGVPPSAAIRRLARIVEYLSHRHNAFFRPLDLVTFWSSQLVFVAEQWQQKFGPHIRVWLASVGELEALTSLSAYAYEQQDDVFPQFVEPEVAGNNPLFEAEDMAHPLVPAHIAVRNDFKLGNPLRLVILSGPNMAGKSTFIRAIGLNAVLAQCGAPVRAARLRLSPLTVAASICILDSLSGGVSRFYAEIQRVKRIADLTSGPAPVLFLLDELLSGTNSHDRLAGTEYIVRSLIERNAIGIVSTHDLALTQIPVAMGDRASNFHFEDRLDNDRLDNDRLIFDYKLKPGVVKTSNALQLMRSIGLDVVSEPTPPRQL